MCWMSMQEHRVDEKKGRRAIIRLDYQHVSGYFMTRADWKNHVTSNRPLEAASRCTCSRRKRGAKTPASRMSLGSPKE